MTYIESITEEHMPILRRKAEEWQQIGLATGPMDIERAKQGAIAAYEAAKLAPPSYFVTMKSPFYGAIAAYVVREMFDVLSEMQLGKYKAKKAPSQPYDTTTPLYQTIVEVWNQLLPQFRAIEGSEFPNEDAAYDAVMRHIHAITKKSGMKWESNPIYGSHDAAWLAFYDTLGELGVPNTREPMHGMMEVAKTAGWWWSLTDVVIFTERPSYMHRDDEHRLHCEDGPAIMYPDGWHLYAWHGVIVNQQIIEAPETMTAQQIVDEENAEIKRVMLERYGLENLIRNLNAQKLDASDFGTLWKADIREEEPLVMVEVDCPSTDRTYMLRVPPTMERARQAVAWTFGYDDEMKYQPEVQT